MAVLINLVCGFALVGGAVFGTLVGRILWQTSAYRGRLKPWMPVGSSLAAIASLSLAQVLPIFFVPLLFLAAAGLMVSLPPIRWKQ